MKPATHGLSKLSIRAFQVLAQENKMMFSYQIADKLGITQRNVYRILKPLVDSRMVTEGKLFRKVYKVRPLPYARRMYIRRAEREFDLLLKPAYDGDIGHKE